MVKLPSLLLQHWVKVNSCVLGYHNLLQAGVVAGASSPSWVRTEQLPFVSGEHPFGPDGGRAEEAADDCGPSVHQQHEALLHRQVQRFRPGGNEVQHQGSALVRHPRWRRIDGGAQDQVKS